MQFTEIREDRVRRSAKSKRRQKQSNRRKVNELIRVAAHYNAITALEEFDLDRDIDLD